MYIPKHFEENDPGTLRALIAAHPLATWVTIDHTQGQPELLANHIPFTLDPTRGTHGTLVGHVAKANPIWQLFSKTSHSILAFQGPESYITPSWYPSKQEHGKVVPTWNYAVVHAHGMPSAITDAQGLLRIVNFLTNIHEDHLQKTQGKVPWQVSDAPTSYIESLLNAIVGIEIPISKVEGKWKTSQNQQASQQQGVIAGLNGLGTSESLAMAKLVQNLKP
jgi:transcriptional regulator